MLCNAHTPHTPSPYTNSLDNPCFLMYFSPYITWGPGFTFFSELPVYERGPIRCNGSGAIRGEPPKGKRLRKQLVLLPSAPVQEGDR